MILVGLVCLVCLVFCFFAFLTRSEADQQVFQFYKSGVFDDPGCGDNLDHGVAAVGYGTSDDGKEYFKVRNSWGESWGDEGYILLSRSTDVYVNGTCGILSFASMPALRDD
mmetsp:Transcript_24812/g.68389  ORF Transcript_24812/g.68389 Transcript_24812/m.68389 type:complete len:111 (+) Transcript_24812:1365-1697(+)